MRLSTEQFENLNTCEAQSAPQGSARCCASVHNSSLGHQTNNQEANSGTS